MLHLIHLLGRTKIPTVVALAVLLVATWFGWYWVWGVFFLYWAVAAVVMGQAFVVQTVRRDENPALFWVICATWLALAVLTILYDLIQLDAIPEDWREWLELWLGVGYE